MANENEIVAKYVLDTSEFIKGKDEIHKATQELVTDSSELETSFKDLNKESAKALNAKAAKQTADALKETTQSFKSVTGGAKDYLKQQKLLKKESDDANKSFRNLTKELKQIQGQLLTLSKAGKAGSAEFKALSIRAGELQDQMNDLNETVKLQSGPAIENFTSSLGDTQVAITNLDFGKAARNVSIMSQQFQRINIKDLINDLKGFGAGLIQLGTTIITSPIFLIGAAIAAIVYVADQWYKSMNELTISQKALNEVTQASLDDMAEQHVSFESLIDVAKNENLTRRQRQEAIEKINATYPEYLGNLKLETINTDEASEAISNQLKLLDIQTRKKAAQELQIEATKKALKAETSALEENTDWISTGINLLGNKLLADARNIQNREKSIKKANDEANAYRDLIKTYEEQEAALRKATGAQSKFTDTELKAQEDARKAREQELKKAAEDAQKLLEEQRKRLEEMQAIFREAEYKQALERAKTQIDEAQKRLDNENKINDQMLKANLKVRKESRDNLLKIADDESHLYSIRQGALDDALKAKLISEQEYADKSNAIALQKIQDQKAEIDSVIGFYSDLSSIGQSFATLTIDNAEQLAEANKAFAAFNIGLQLATSLSNIIASATEAAAATGPLAPFTLIGYITSGTAAVLGAFAQAKTLLSDEPPKFADGVEMFRAPGTGKSDSGWARLSNGERVVPAATNLEYWDELSAIHNGTFEDLIIYKYLEPALKNAMSDARRADDFAFADNIANAMMLNFKKDEQLAGQLLLGRNDNKKHHKELIKTIAHANQKRAYRKK